MAGFRRDEGDVRSWQQRRRPGRSPVNCRRLRFQRSTPVSAASQPALEVHSPPRRSHSDASWPILVSWPAMAWRASAANSGRRRATARYEALSVSVKYQTSSSLAAMTTFSGFDLNDGLRNR